MIAPRDKKTKKIYLIIIQYILIENGFVIIINMKIQNT